MVDHWVMVAGISGNVNSASLGNGGCGPRCRYIF